MKRRGALPRLAFQGDSRDDGKNLQFGKDWGFEYGASNALIAIVRNQAVQGWVTIAGFLLLLIHVVHHW